MCVFAENVFHKMRRKHEKRVDSWFLQRALGFPPVGTRTEADEDIIQGHYPKDIIQDGLIYMQHGLNMVQKGRMIMQHGPGMA